MTSRRSWLIGLALGAALSFGAPAAHAVGVPRYISYQGVVVDQTTQKGLNGTHQVVITYYDANGTSKGSETFTSVLFTQGIFDIRLGSNLPGGAGFPLAWDFNSQYSIGVAIDAGTEMKSLFSSSPYALNTDMVNGIQASQFPDSGKLWPMPIVGGKIAPSMLPAFVQTINHLTADATGDFEFKGMNGITVKADSLLANTLDIIGAGSGVNSISAGAGIVVAINPGNNYVVSADWRTASWNLIPAGAIQGYQITGIAGAGLVQGAAGPISVNVDGSTLTILNNQVQLALGGVGTAQLANGSVTHAKIAVGPTVDWTQIDPTTVQRRVSGVAPVGSFLVNVAQDGIANTYGTVLNDATLIRSTPGSNVQLGINLANANNWTANQNFQGGSTITGLTVNGAVANFQSGITDNGPFTQTGTSIFNGATTFNGSVALGANAVTGGSFTGYTLNSGTLALGQTLTNNGTITGGAITAATINGSSIGASTPSTGAFTTLSSNSTSNIGTGPNLSNTFGTGANSTNTYGAPSSANTFNGLNQVTGVTTFGTTGSADGQRVIINGQPGGAFELLVNGDAQITGTMSGQFVVGTASVSSPSGFFDNVSTNNPSNNSINFARGISLNGGVNQNNLQVGGNATISGFETVAGLLTSNGGHTNNGAFNQNGTSSFNGTIAQTSGTSSFAGLLTANGGISDNGTFTQNGNIVQTTGSASLGAITAPSATISGLTSSGTFQNTGATFTVNGAGGVVATSYTGGTFGGSTGNFTTSVTSPSFLGGTFNGSAVTAATFTGGTFTGTTATFTGLLSANAGIVTNNSNINAGSGNISGGAISGTTGTFTGAVNGGSFQNTNSSFTVSAGGAVIGSSFTGGPIAGTTGTFSGAITGASLNTGTGPISGGNVTGSTITANGANSLVQIVGGQSGIQTHANTATRTYTWPDKSGTVALLSDVASLDNPTAANQTLRSVVALTPSGFKWTPTNNMLNDGGTVTITGNLTASGGVNSFGGTSNFTTGGTVNINSTSVNIGGGTIVSTDPISEGNTATPFDQNWMTITGVRTAWTTLPFGGLVPNPPNAALLTSPFSNLNFENIVVGDQQVTGTFMSGAVYTALMAAQNIRFDVAAPFTPGGTMTFNGGISPTAPGTPVITINNIPAGSFGEQITAGAGVAGGTQITGGGAGTGLVISSFPTGESVSATTTGINFPGGAGNVPVTGIAVIASGTGETINMNTAGVGTGLTIGASVAPLTGETINSTANGLNITSGNISISATGRINSDGTTVGAIGSSFTANLGASPTLSVANTNNVNAPALQVIGAFTSSGNSTVGTNAGTSNSFGNGGGATINSIGNGGTTLNLIGTGGASNVVGRGAVTNWFGDNSNNGGPATTINNIGTADFNAGATVNNNLGTAVAGTTVNNAIGSTTGAVTNTILGTTTINSTGNALTTIGTPGAGTSATTINVGTGGGALTLTGIPVSLATINFLTTDGAGKVWTNPLNNFIQGTNGVLVTYAGGVATAQFANTNALVPFTSNRFVNLDASNLNFTSNAGAANPLVITGGVAPTITTLGTTNINANGGATTNIATSAAATTNIGLPAGTNTILGATTINNISSATTQIGNVAGYGNITMGNTGAGAGTITLNAGAAGTVGVNGTTNITGATTVLGTTLINSTLNAATTIGTAGGGTSATTINVGTGGGALTLTGIPASVATTNFLTTDGAGKVWTNALNNFVQGSNGVLVVYAGGTATAQFANTNALVPFTSDRYINTNLSTLHITTGAGGADYATINGATNTGTITGPTNINTTGGATTNIATIAAATTNIGLPAGTNTILGGTTINNAGSATTQIGNIAGFGNITLGNTGAGAGSLSLNAGAAGTVAVNGTTNITGATTVLGTTLINSTLNAATTIGTAGAGTSATTINVGTGGGALTLTGIPASVATTAFLTTDGAGKVWTNTLNNFVQGSNGVLVVYAGGTATAQFANTNALVPFTTNRFVNLDLSNLNFTSNGGAANPFIITGGAVPTLTSLGATNINITGGAATTIGNPANTPVSTTFNGAVSMVANGQAVDELTISNVVGGQWGIRTTIAPAAGNALGDIATTTSTAANIGTAGSFTATGVGTTNTGVIIGASGASTVANVGANVAVSGGSVNNTGISLTTSGAVTSNTGGSFTVTGGAVTNTGLIVSASGAVTNNVGASISVNGTGRVGANINANGAGTGIIVNNAATGIDIPGIGGTLPNAAIGVNVKLTPTNAQTGVNIDMNGGLAGTNGEIIQNVQVGSGLLINSVTGAGTGIGIVNGGSGTGISVSSEGTGIGIKVGAPTTGVAIQTFGDGTPGTAALEVNNGSVRATGAAQWASTYTLSPADKAGNDFIINNPLIVNGSTIIITVDANIGAANGLVFVGNDASDATGFVAGHFHVRSTAVNFAAAFKIHYMIINH